MVSHRTYNDREMRRFLARAISQFTPAALIQFLQMDFGSASARIRELVWRILNYYCSHFIQHAQKWTTNPELRPLETMRDYHQMWEGWACDEPYFDSQHHTIKYFMNDRRHVRIEEMERQFISRP